MTFRPGAPTRTISFGGGGPPSRDVIAMLIIVGVTYSLAAFTSAVDILRLTPMVWRGWLWQLGTYPWIGAGPPSIWILLELLILYWFANDVFWALGRRRFWNLFLWATIGAAFVAALMDVLLTLAGFGVPTSFVLMQGQRMLILVAIAAFATLRSEATILLFFVLPLKARWFLWIEIAIGFVGFLGTKDFPGFVGICAAVALSVLLLRPGRGRGVLREARVRSERWWIERKLGRMRKKSGLRVVPRQEDDDSVRRGPWVN
ncbi:MAG TPA: hypothetical protein VMT85_17065 [Thermoanaerobaculia bacterium]|nr:hypothetical protein [Thermoanaerobaculia bacterium]